MKTERTAKFQVYQLDMWKDEGGWYQNDRFDLGVLSIPLAMNQLVNDKTILQAMREFEVTDIAGRSWPALNTTDRRRVYAEDPYCMGEWWEVGEKKDHRPMFGLQFLGEYVDFGEEVLA